MNNMNQMNGFNQQGQQGQMGNNNGEEEKFVLNFQPNDILQKEFKTKMRGYDPTEVDQFLDGIIKDYESFSNELTRLRNENASLKSGMGNNNATSRPEPNKAVNNRMRPQANRPATSATSEASTNYDILRRLSNLERHVFGHDFSNGFPNGETKPTDSVKQFASAAVPNNANNVENNQDVNSNFNVNNANQNFNNLNNQNPNHFQNGRMAPNQGQNMNGFNKNGNNGGNFNQF